MQRLPLASRRSTSSFAPHSLEPVTGSTNEANGGAAVMSQTTNLPIELHDVSDLLERAQRGDREAIPALRTYLDGNSQIWQSAGDLAAQTEQVLIGVVSGSDL